MSNPLQERDSMHCFGIVSSQVDPWVVPKARYPSGRRPGEGRDQDSRNGMFLIEGGSQQ